MNEKQLKFLKKININPESPLDVIESAVADYLELYGFDENYKPTEAGKMCEEILDYISEQE